MATRTDVVVIGGGPAGLSAAAEAAEAGLDVILVDENQKPGGQIYRQAHSEFEGGEPRPGDALIARARGLPIRLIMDGTVWGQLEPGILEVARRGRTERLAAQAIVVAVGANDRPAALPGWTLPGVLTAGGAQGLLKSQGILPGRRILLAGAGPLQLVLAAQLARAGAKVVGVAEAVPAAAYLRHAFALAWGGTALIDGLRYKLAVRRAGVPWMAPTILTGIHGDDRVQAAVVARADRDWRPVRGTERVFEVDSVCVGYGLVPSLEVVRLLGCRVQYEPVGDAWVPIRSEECETTIPNVFAVGDGAGVAGAQVAEEEGRLAGLVIAARLAGAAVNGSISRTKRRIRRLQRFASAVNQICTPGPGLYELALNETEICRCEEVTLGRLRDCLREGACSASELKAWTGVGMGPCQGKMCAAAVIRLVSQHTGLPRQAVKLPSVRPPVRSIQLACLLAGADGASSPVPRMPSNRSHQIGEEVS